MKAVITVVLAAVLGCGIAHADVWKWVDANGRTHFVDSKTPIYTWTDRDGRVYYSDTPEHKDAVSVQLVWHSSGSLNDAQDAQEDPGSEGAALPGETDAQRIEREAAEAYYCKRATEIYESYANAPRLYRTDEKGEREYLSRTELKKTIDEARQQKEELCR